MELIEKLKKQLSEEYGIHSDQELISSEGGVAYADTSAARKTN